MTIDCILVDVCVNVVIDIVICKLTICRLLRAPICKSIYVTFSVLHGYYSVDVILKRLLFKHVIKDFILTFL